MSSNQPLIVSDIDEGPQTLQQRFQEWGYLHVKGYVASEVCDQLLDELLAVLAPYIGFDQQQQKPVLTGPAFGETDPIWDKVYPKMQSLESFHSFFHTDPIAALMDKLQGKPSFVYPIKMARISTPNNLGFETPPHQDAHSHNAGPTMAGIWVALHDVNDQMGRLKVLPRSHKHGVRKIGPADGVGGVQCEIFPDETTWHVSDVEQGDVILFHSCTIHKAEPNTAKDLVRISIDTRFCDYGAPVFSTNLEPHHGWRIEGLCWESIYQNWQHKELQYYWQDYPSLF
ncbi:phytanoyl-CoA dioxygenase family protein [Oceanicoccus sagamiensis]|uniref:Phytanoyl-CoA dioxygenase n=1 Tax=Oceanicoccus sagamiensis TaxID=716816 RepID=A0A1X9NG35_9GAMM|nr:phytanoyl-CoA dioxygenase family protein [Oceanicoccus sagamiensis]ARN73907.1 phytanoyl-CoA dioxygenase [Oceanicoccus sagamiensis]